MITINLLKYIEIIYKDEFTMFIYFILVISVILINNVNPALFINLAYKFISYFFLLAVPKSQTHHRNIKG